MKKLSTILIIILCWILSSSPAFTYTRVETDTTIYRGDSIYFVKTFYDTNLYDKDFQHEKGDIAIKIAVENNSDSTAWYDHATKIMVNEGVSAGWRRADYTYFLKEQFLRAAQENNSQKKQILHALITGLEKVKKRKQLSFLNEDFISLYIQKRMVQPSLLRSALSGTNSLASDYTDRVVEVLQSCLPANHYVEPDVIVHVLNNSYLETRYNVGGREKKLYYKKGEPNKHFVELFKKISRRLGNDGLRPLENQK